jgi:hypothetical protein
VGDAGKVGQLVSEDLDFRGAELTEIEFIAEIPGADFSAASDCGDLSGCNLAPPNSGGPIFPMLPR